ncbi:hypothetical protein NPIL_517481 [Nephila pilipes]|uniref:Uncharacterized protein n=1 Tax=Nephila pilipes TaxID=299642 RepID=A0A8X6QX62_NEPPI|nr:hypothetical protein NPIL_517481 [Nephila pilipes]
MPRDENVRTIPSIDSSWATSYDTLQTKQSSQCKMTVCNVLIIVYIFGAVMLVICPDQYYPLRKIGASMLGAIFVFGMAYFLYKTLGVPRKSRKVFRSIHLTKRKRTGRKHQQAMGTTATHNLIPETSEVHKAHVDRSNRQSTTASLGWTRTRRKSRVAPASH